MKLKFRIDTYVFGEVFLNTNTPSLYVEEDINESAIFTDEITRIAKKHCSGEFRQWDFMNVEELFYQDLLSEDLLEHLSPTLIYDYSPLAVPASTIIKAFSLESKELWIAINGQGIGYAVGSYEGLVFTLHTKESNKHHGKHIHCSYSGETIVIDLVSLQIIEGRFKNRKKARKALDIVKLNQESFLASWDSAVNKGITMTIELRYE